MLLPHLSYNEQAQRSFYDFEASLLSGKRIQMSEFAGSTVLVVNTASKCGLTPQYQGLERLYQQYRHRGLVVLGFPCNQFGGQERGNSSDIQQFCQLHYGVHFPMFAKIHVNGKHAHPLFRFLKTELRGYLGARIQWNFTKFLIDKKGVPIKRFAPFTTPKRMDPFIQAIL